MECHDVRGLDAEPGRQGAPALVHNVAIHGGRRGIVVSNCNGSGFRDLTIYDPYTDGVYNDVTITGDKYVQTADGQVVEYRVEGGPPNALYRQGWRKDTLKAGDVVTVSGIRAKREDNQAFDSYEVGGKPTAFDGDYKRQKLSEQDYLKAAASADERYAQMLTALLAQLKKQS